MLSMVSTPALACLRSRYVAQLTARTTREGDDPIRMLAVKIAVGVDHLRFNPQSEIQARAVYVIDQRFQPLRELLWIRVPIAEARPVVIAFSKPAGH